MSTVLSSTPRRPAYGLLLIAGVTALLNACGGSTGTNSSSDAAVHQATGTAEVATGTTTFGMTSATYSLNAASVVLKPTYHLAPILPTPPSNMDAWGQSLSAHLAPQRDGIPESVRSKSTRRLTPDQLVPAVPVSIGPDGSTTSSTSTYSPAQIRAAYGLPAVPGSFAGFTAAQLAQFGAGQTVYIIDANDDPQAFGELDAFSQLFGLPQCTQKTLASNASLPLPAPSSGSCDFYQIYSTTSGSMTSTAPSYDPNWAVEIALDVQWVHATAPLARIVLIESADASLPGLTGSISLANQMGGGVVSMSFGGAEGSYVTSMDSYFQTANMSYFAATGDNGEAVSWPSVSPHVVAVGATSLTYSGSGTRSESAWSGTGGGVSAYEPTPSYQTSVVPGMTAYGHRSVADVAFNGNPNTGQFVAVVPNQLTCTFCQVSWLTVGGTSLSTPQWAGLAAVANAIRVQAGKTMLGDLHSALYQQIASTASTYASDFADITSGTDGSCSVCSAKKGYDIPTGLGTPNGTNIVNALAGSVAATLPPVVTGATITGNYGQALSFTATIVDTNTYTASLANAPAGMTISNTGVVKWTSPTSGNYSVTVIAKDSKTGMTGQGVYSVMIIPPPPPVVSAANITGTTTAALSFKAAITDTNPYTLTLSGAPSGMTISSTGAVSWTKPIAGSYKITVTAKDSKTGLSGTGDFNVTITGSGTPAVSSGNVGGSPGTALAIGVTVTDTNPYTLTLAGAPSGMVISGGTIKWPSPVKGIYNVTVAAKDSKTGLSGEGVYVINIATATGPTVTGTGLTGVAGQPLSGTISITDASASIIGMGIAGAPLNMSFNPVNGAFNNIAVSWPSPVAGTYTLEVSTNDSAGNEMVVTLPVTITSH